MKVLISPAKSIDMNREISTPTPTVAAFLNDSEKLIYVLRKLKSEDIQKLMHVSQDIADLNVQRNTNWEKPIAQSVETCPAIVAFTGEVYRGLNVSDFSHSDFEKAQNTIRILSGLYGILKPLDLIRPYRLEMGTRLAIDSKNKNLYQYWGDKLVDFLQKELTEEEVVVNLASTEYSKAIPFEKLKNKVITPIFKDFKNGNLKVVSVYAKHARGEMARWILLNQIQTADELVLFKEMNYQYDSGLSTGNEIVFTR